MVAADPREVADRFDPGVGVVEAGLPHRLHHQVLGGGHGNDGFVQEVGRSSADGDFDPVGHFLVPEGGGDGDGGGFFVEGGVKDFDGVVVVLDGVGRGGRGAVAPPTAEGVELGAGDGRY